MKNILIATIATCTALIAHSADRLEAPAILDCPNELASVRNIVEPLRDSTRTYGNGSTRILHLDTGGEPACCSSYLAILAPDPKSELGDRQCKVLASNAHGLGFMSISMLDVSSAYDSTKGLLLTIPVKLYKDGITSVTTYIKVRVNQSSGDVVLE